MLFISTILLCLFRHKNTVVSETLSRFTVSCHKVIDVVFMIQHSIFEDALTLLDIFKERSVINSDIVVLLKTNK